MYSLHHQGRFPKVRDEQVKPMGALLFFNNYVVLWE
jgi:hypothetical protein